MAKLRIEFERIGGGRGLLGGQLAIGEQDLLGAVTLTVTATPTAAGSRPVVPAVAGQVYGRLIALDAACYVDAGPSPDPTTGSPFLVVPGHPVRLRLTSGDKLSAVLASDVPGVVQQVAQANGLALTLSTVAVTATSAQKLAANANRRYLMVENIGTGDATLNFGAAAVIGQGKPLNAADASGRQGGSFAMEGSAVTTQAINAVSTAGTTLMILEG